MIKCVFLDRDGTICEDMDYLSDYRKMVFYPFALEAVRVIKEKGYKIFIITNQSGVARGKFDIAEAERQKNHVLNYFGEKGVVIDGYFYCPHHKDGVIIEFAKECDCRKPKTGLLKQAVSLEFVDKNVSYIVGDKVIDVELAFNAGIKGALVLTGYGKLELEVLKKKSLDFSVYADLLEFAKAIA